MERVGDLFMNAREGVCRIEFWRTLLVAVFFLAIVLGNIVAVGAALYSTGDKRVQEVRRVRRHT